MNAVMQRLRGWSVRDAGILVVFIALVFALWLVSPGHHFLSVNNVLLILVQTTINGILAMGMMYVIISGEIDLSVGSTIALAGVVAAMLAHPGEYPVVVPILAALTVGALVGLLNGVGVAYGAIPSFIVTLGTMTAVRGLALIVSGGAPVFNVSATFEAVASVKIGRFPVMAIYLVVIFAICAFVLSRTVYGRRVYAVGGNPVAAEVSGVNVKRSKVSVFVIAGLLAGFCGVLLASRTISGSPTAGESYELDAIAAVVIGGVSMSGGRGRASGVLIGALMIAVIANGLDILGIDANFQRLVKGAIIVAAVLLDVKARRRS
ncbi:MULTISPECIES: ABC transporter permease [Actinomyces]|uniref:Ribose transport system permease protein n=1 Tax=Actinomyces ruminicola TaxID=332524 RepID=A0A1G9UCL9_9ACTO|nr:MULTISPECIES: ABC transporter permease [Actinomyces]SDM57680.1 ribose transport system permease protein [Actinomyces ruminicola]